MESSELSQRRLKELEHIETGVLAHTIAEVYESAREHQRIRLFLLNEDQEDQGRRLVEPRTVKANGWLGDRDPANQYVLTIHTNGLGGFSTYFTGPQDQPKRAEAFIGRREDDSLMTEPLSKTNDLTLQEMQAIASSASQDVERQISELIDVDVT